mmetsp:Transcript_16205/g.21474  ORF Transcript_16205/g.21474 Transcript_16205/m.21474 type:complete len:266 (+) Transcript_16205:2829-3626(+)
MPFRSTGSTGVSAVASAVATRASTWGALGTGTAGSDLVLTPLALSCSSEVYVLCNKLRPVCEVEPESDLLQVASERGSGLTAFSAEKCGSPSLFETLSEVSVSDSEVLAKQWPLVLTGLGSSSFVVAGDSSELRTLESTVRLLSVLSASVKDVMYKGELPSAMYCPTLIPELLTMFQSELLTPGAAPTPESFPPKDGHLISLGLGLGRGAWGEGAGRGRFRPKPLPTRSAPAAPTTGKWLIIASPRNCVLIPPHILSKSYDKEAS